MNTRVFSIFWSLAVALPVACPFLASAQQPPGPMRPPLPGQRPAPVDLRKPSSSSIKAADQITVQFPSSPLNEVLDFYQQLTGKRTIRDPHLENATVSIETSGAMSKDQAIEFMEKSLLLAGYAIVPSGEKMVKVIAFEAGRNPASEHVDMILREADLPKTDQVVTYLMPLQYLKSDEAAQAFSQIIPPHPYGKIVAVPNAHALVITENSNTIRAYVELNRQVDVPPEEVTHKTIQLERADAEEVAKDLAELLGISGGVSGSSGHGGGRAANGQNSNAQRLSIHINQPGVPNVPGAPAVNPVTNVGGSTESDAAAPKIQAISRTNSLLVVARPLDIEYIESLVKEFDAESNVRGFVSRRLRYMDVVDFANVAKDALLRGAKDQGGGAAGGLKGTEEKTTASTTPSNTGSNNNNNQGYGGSLFGGSGGAGGYSGFNSGAGLQETQVAKTQSVVVGKTVLIVDPGSSRYYASGPPEQLRLLESLADELDIRPQQILLSAIIGEFTLSGDFQFGLDWTRTLQTLGNNGSSISGTLNNTGGSAVNFTSFAKQSDFPFPSGLTVYGQVGKYASGFLSALETSKRFHVLQRPWVSTLNHKLATISTGQQIAIPGQSYTTGNASVQSAGIYSTTQYIPVELRLDIIPHIYSNNEVKLEFNQTNNDVSGFTTISGNQVPNLSTQSLKNTIIVPNGGTVLLGGLITERDTKNKSGLPLLVRIPVLKYLFGSTTKNKERDEMLLFVQPRILSNGGDYVQEQMELEKQAHSYPETQAFIEHGESAPSPTPPRARRVTDEEMDAKNQINIDSRFRSKN